MAVCRCNINPETTLMKGECWDTAGFHVGLTAKRSFWIVLELADHRIAVADKLSLFCTHGSRLLQ